MQAKNFEKSAECPTSELLLVYLQTVSPTAAMHALEEHLSGCEFCELSLELLRAYPDHLMPANLFIPEPPEQIRRLPPALRTSR